MRISTDGGVTWTQVEELYVEFGDLTADLDPASRMDMTFPVTLLLKLTQEGVVTDVCRTDRSTDEVVGSASETAQEITDRITHI